MLYVRIPICATNAMVLIHATYQNIHDYKYASKSTYVVPCTVAYLRCMLRTVSMSDTMHGHKLHCMPQYICISVVRMRYSVQHTHAVQNHLCCISILHAVMLISILCHNAFFALCHDGHI